MLGLAANAGWEALAVLTLGVSVLPRLKFCADLLANPSVLLGLVALFESPFDDTARFEPRESGSFLFYAEEPTIL